MIITTIIVVAVVFVLTLAGGFYLFFATGVNPQISGPLVFGVIGVSLIALGSVIALDSYRFIQQADSVVGEVISIDESYNRANEGSMTKTYTPKVRFRSSQGQVIEFYGPSSNYIDYQQGERIELRYLPEEPEKVRIKGFDKFWLAAAILLLIGVVFTGIALRVAFTKTDK